jgi:hypothetical protein
MAGSAVALIRRAGGRGAADLRAQPASAEMARALTGQIAVLYDESAMSSAGTRHMPIS